MQKRIIMLFSVLFPYGVMVSITDFESVCFGSNPDRGTVKSFSLDTDG